MTQRPRIGELLGRLVTLSGHDVEEILEEQKSTGRRFGEIALAWGLCAPEHLREAWTRQISDALERIDLDDVGIDAQATALITGDVARTLHVIPVRASDDEAVVATLGPLSDPWPDELSQMLGRHVKYVTADARQLHNAIEQYYPAVQV